MEFVISEFNGEAQQRIMEMLNKEYLSTGKYVKDQMSVSPKVLSSLMVSSSIIGTDMSAATSSSLYMTTAKDPGMLMQAKNGVLSAIVGPNGRIIEQAPFIPVASSLPVVAPLMAMQALSTVVILQQFSVMDKKLNAIKSSIDKILARQEATKVAELFAAVAMVDEIYSQYNQTGHFTTDMLIRLALTERDAMILSRRYEILESASGSDADGSNIDNLYNHDTFCTMLASFLNLRVKYLRTCVDIQENPQFVQHSFERFDTLLKDDIVLWDKLLHKSDKLKADIDELTSQLEKGNKGLQKIAQIAKEKELSRKKDEYTAAMEKEKVILNDFHALIDIAINLSEEMNTKKCPKLLYWRDQQGEHCIATNERFLESA